MNKLKKYTLIILLALILITVAYYFIPLTLKIRSNMKSKFPDTISILESGVDNNGRPMSNSIVIEDKKTIIDIYTKLNQVKLIKSFKTSLHSNQYGFNFIYFSKQSSDIKSIAISSNGLLSINNRDYNIVNSSNLYNDITILFKQLQK